MRGSQGDQQETQQDQHKSTVMDLDNALRSTYKIFKRFDKDRSGTLDKEEILSLLKACNIAVTEAECSDCLTGLDSNGDGVWDFTEFMTFLGMIYSIKLESGTAQEAEPAEQSNGNEQRKAKPKAPPRKDSIKSN